MLDNKYQIVIEFRYTEKTTYVEDGEVMEGSNYKNHKIKSELMDTPEYAITKANELIAVNKWIEQFPGYVGCRLSNKYRLQMFRLKNGTQIFIQIETVKLRTFGGMDKELRKFMV